MKIPIIDLYLSFDKNWQELQAHATDSAKMFEGRLVRLSELLANRNNNIRVTPVSIFIESLLLSIKYDKFNTKSDELSFLLATDPFHPNVPQLKTAIHKLREEFKSIICKYQFLERFDVSDVEPGRLLHPRFYLSAKELSKSFPPDTLCTTIEPYFESPPPRVMPPQPGLSLKQVVDRILTAIHFDDRLELSLNYACDNMEKYNSRQYSFAHRTRDGIELIAFITDPRKGTYSVGAWWNSSRGKIFVLPTPHVSLFLSEQFLKQYSDAAPSTVSQSLSPLERFVFGNGTFPYYQGADLAFEGHSNLVPFISEEGICYSPQKPNPFLSFEMFVHDHQLSPSQLSIVTEIRKNTCVAPHRPESDEAFMKIPISSN